LEFKHPFTEKIMHFEVPVPNEFIKICWSKKLTK
jgi:hypothetical protein